MRPVLNDQFSGATIFRNLQIESMFIHHHKAVNIHHVMPFNISMRPRRDEAGFREETSTCFNSRHSLSIDQPSEVSSRSCVAKVLHHVIHGNNGIARTFDGEFE